MVRCRELLILGVGAVFNTGRTDYPLAGQAQELSTRGPPESRVAWDAEATKLSQPRNLINKYHFLVVIRIVIPNNSRFFWGALKKT